MVERKGQGLGGKEHKAGILGQTQEMQGQARGKVTFHGPLMGVMYVSQALLPYNQLPH